MPMFYFFFAAFTGFFDFAFLTILNMRICLLPYKFMLVDLSYLPFTMELFEPLLKGSQALVSVKIQQLGI